jgi:hypothetical protein
MAEKVFDSLKRLEKKHPAEAVKIAYQFRLEGLTKEDYLGLKELVDDQRLTESISESTGTCYVGSDFIPKKLEFAKKMEKLGLLRWIDETRYALTQKAFELFPR